MRQLPTFESVVSDLESHKLDVKLDSESFKQFTLSNGNSIDYFEITISSEKANALQTLDESYSEKKVMNQINHPGAQGESLWRRLRWKHL